MHKQPPRLTQPRRWQSLAIAGAAATLSAATPLWADTQGTTPGAGAAAAQVEGGEGGEAGAVAGIPADVAYLTRLEMVEGHLDAAVTLYRKGLTDEGTALSYHPEAEMMDDVRADLAAHGAADFTPALSALSETMAAGAPVAQVEAAFQIVRAGIAAAEAKGTGGDRARFDALAALTRAAVVEYRDSTEAAEVDVVPFHEAMGFVAVARTRAELLTKGDHAAAAGRVLAALADTGSAFGDPAATVPVAGDATALPATAARLELIAASVK